MTPPLSVYLIAFDSRLPRIWRTRLTSVSTIGTSWETSTVRDSPAVSAVTRYSSANVETSSRRLRDSSRMGSSPASERTSWWRSFDHLQRVTDRSADTRDVVLRFFGSSP